MSDVHSGAVKGVPLILVRLEGLVVLVAAVLCFRWLGGGWEMFALLFLLPDLSMLGYLVGKRVGAAAYNAGHSYVGPALFCATGLLQGDELLPKLAVIWVAHIGFDRMLGYGLKYGSAFGHTHLGLKGKAARTAEKPLLA